MEEEAQRWSIWRRKFGIGGGGGGLVSVQKGAFFSVTCGGGPAKRERISESAFFGGETEVPLLYRGIETGIYPGKGSGWICKGEKGKTR